VPRVYEPASPNRAPEEVDAARLFNLLTGLDCHQLDGAIEGENLADFMLASASGDLVGTLEVTQHTNPAARSTAGALDKYVRIDGSGLSGYWQVTVEVGVRAKGSLATEVEELLILLEVEGHDRVWSGDELGRSLRLDNNGIISAAKLSGCTRRGASVLCVDPGGTTSRDVLADVVEREVEKNQVKLQPSQGQQRHLLVWLEWACDDGADAMAAAIRRQVPGPAPRRPIPNVNCTVWLAVPGQQWALRWRHQDGWCIVTARGERAVGTERAASVASSTGCDDITVRARTVDAESLAQP
jgi:hypothetical protein